MFSKCGLPVLNRFSCEVTLRIYAAMARVMVVKASPGGRDIDATAVSR